MYKKIFALISSVLLLASLNLSAQIRKIPAVVTAAFAAKYPEAKTVEWNDNLTNFEASFEMDAHEQHAIFSSKGIWKKTDKVIHQEEIPTAVKEGLSKSKYADWEIKESIETLDNNKKIVYRLLVRKSGLQKKSLVFTPEGQLTRDAITL